MKVKFVVIGKTNHKYVEEGCTVFFKRLKHYTNFEYKIVDDIKHAGKLSVVKRKEQEGKQLLNVINNQDFVVLLDEKGKSFSSVSFAQWIEKQQINATSTIVFIVGGAFGFSAELYARANMKMQLSSMTFSHQLIRLIFAEQIYRAFTIIKGEPYHNV